jgi:hypothetical protein
MAMAYDEKEFAKSTGFRGLIVKVKSEVGGTAGGKVFLIPESELSRFQFTPQDQERVNGALAGRWDNLDYAIFDVGIIIMGSSGG